MIELRKDTYVILVNVLRIIFKYETEHMEDR